MEKEKQDMIKRQEEAKIRAAQYLLDMFLKYGAEVMEENRKKGNGKSA